MRLSNFFKTPSSWIKGNLAVDMDNIPINMMAYSEIEMRDRKIKAMSLHGALGYFYNFEKEPERRNKMMNNLRKAISFYSGKNYNIAEYNNLESTTFEDIVKVIKIAEKL